VYWDCSLVGRWNGTYASFLGSTSPNIYQLQAWALDVPSIVSLNQLHTIPSFYLLIISKVTLFIFSSYHPSDLSFIYKLSQGWRCLYFHLTIHPRHSVVYNFFCYSSQGVMLCNIYSFLTSVSMDSDGVTSGTILTSSSDSRRTSKRFLASMRAASGGEECLASMHATSGGK